VNLKEIKDRVLDISNSKTRNNRIDSELAHISEDALHLDFIKYISETGTEEQREMAEEVLKSEKLDFARWFS